MPRAKPAGHVRQFEEQRARITAEIQRVRSRESQEERKRETRRKILLGAMLLDRIKRGEVPETVVKADMDRFLDRPQERALFELPPKAARATKTGGRSTYERFLLLAGSAAT